MQEILAGPKLSRPQVARLIRYALPAVILIALLSGLGVYRASLAPQPLPGRSAPAYISADTLKDLYGIRVTLIAVTAAGGLVDWRFKVLNADKAQSTFQDDARRPVLEVQGTGVRLSLPDKAFHDAKLEEGKVYYALLGNTGGAVKPGSPVSVVIGDLRLEPIIAK